MKSGCRLRPLHRRITQCITHFVRLRLSRARRGLRRSEVVSGQRGPGAQESDAGRRAGRGLSGLGGPRPRSSARRSEDDQDAGRADSGRLGRAGLHRHRRLVSGRARRHRSPGRGRRAGGHLCRQFAVRARTRKVAEAVRAASGSRSTPSPSPARRPSPPSPFGCSGICWKSPSARTRPRSASSPRPTPKKARCGSSPRKRATRHWTSPTTSAGATRSSARSACSPSPSPASTLMRCCKGPGTWPPPRIRRT